MNNHYNTKRLAYMALFAAVALGLWELESLIPMPLPGVKPGLANIVTLVAMVLLGRREAGDILFVRVILASVFSYNPSAVIFSLAGGAAAWIVMALVLRFFEEKNFWVVGVLGALGHNAGQLAAARFYYNMPFSELATMLPWLIIAAVVAGAFTGVVGMLLLPRLRKLIHLEKPKETAEPAAEEALGAENTMQSEDCDS